MAKEEEISIMAGKLRKDCSYSNVLEAAMKIPKEQHPVLYEMLKEYDFSKIIFDKKEDPERRRGAILIYSHIGPQEKMKSLFPLALDSNESEGVRVEALFSLEKAKIGDESLIPIVDNAGENVGTKRAAIYALCVSGVDLKILSALFKRHLNDKEKAVHDAALNGLERLGETTPPVIERILRKKSIAK
jgi:HEAT repeat protein